MYKYSNILRKVYLWTLLFSFILIMSIAAYTHFNTDIKDLNKLAYSKIENRDIKSIVFRRSFNKYNPLADYIIYGKDSLPALTGWNEKIEIGDSIIKPKGSLKLIIKNNLKIDTLDYEKNSKEILTTNF